MDRLTSLQMLVICSAISYARAFNINPLGFTPNTITPNCTAKSIPCGAADLTAANWVASKVDDIVTCKLQEFVNTQNPPSRIPQAYLNSESNHILEASGFFDCSDVTKADGCTFPGANTDGPAGTNCDFMSDNGGFPQDGLVFTAFAAAFTTLNQWHTAVQVAHDQLVSENFVDNMVAAVIRQKLPIPRSVLFKLVEISLSFIPSPEGFLAGAELKAAKTAIKKFKTVAKKRVGMGEDDAKSQEANDKDQGNVLKKFLDDMVPNFQSGVKDQHAAIFLDPVAAFDPFYMDLLAGGDVLNMQSQETHTEAMKRNMEAFLMAQMMANTGMVLVLDKNLESCDSGDINDGTHCRRFGYEQDRFIPATGATIDRPSNIGAMGGFGFSLKDISDNAIACHEKGGSFQSVDFDAFLESDGALFPDCLFGIPINDIS